MIHLIDSDEQRNLRDVVEHAQTNCGQQLTDATIRFKNDWGNGQCKTWLDGRDICEPCRSKAMERTPLQFTYGVSA